MWRIRLQLPARCCRTQHHHLPLCQWDHSGTVLQRCQLHMPRCVLRAVQTIACDGSTVTYCTTCRMLQDGQVVRPVFLLLGLCCSLRRAAHSPSLHVVWQVVCLCYAQSPGHPDQGTLFEGGSFLAGRTLYVLGLPADSGCLQHTAVQPTALHKWCQAVWMSHQVRQTESVINKGT